MQATAPSASTQGMMNPYSDGAKGSPQRLAEGGGVETDLALVDDALQVVVEELDRVLDRDDVLGAARVHVTDDRRERGRLAGAGRARDQHQPATLLGECGDALRKPEVREARNLGRDHAERERDRSPLAEAVDAEAREAGRRVGEIELTGGIE